ncbi:MAG: methyltransferase domain-containing protein [Dehalococcoidia bacterium]|nr:methyltransferase domain-containing protein [Dehalococcoidia bacterium]
MRLYDELPYPLLTHSSTHPDRLAVVGRLMGMKPAAPDRCHLLDLGCGAGANIIAMAELLPESSFAGIDYSESQIETGKAIVARGWG